jgi:phytoene dehydrogenase-like protein
MKLSHNYDWIVLGDHPGALLSANMVIRLGLSVLIVPKCSTQKVIFSESGQCLDPESNFILGLGEQGLLHEILRKASALPGEGELGTLEGYAQVLTPRHRFSVSDSVETSTRELQREFSEGSEDRELIEQGISSAAEVLEYWRRFPSRYNLDLTQRKTPKKVSASWDDLLKALRSKKNPLPKSDLLSALTYGFSGQAFENATRTEWIHILALGQSGASFKGGMTAYRRMLLNVAKQQGATVLENVECRRIFVSNRRFMGVQLSSSGNMIAGAGCILGSTFNEFSERIAVGKSNWLRPKSSAAKPSGWRFTLALTVHDEAIIPGMSRRMIWKEENAPIVEIETADPSEYGARDTDHKLIFLRTVLPYSQESLAIAYQRTIASRMFRLATEIIPFLEDHVTRIYPDFRPTQSGASHSLDWKDELSEIYGFATPKMIPENLLVYNPSDDRDSTGIEGLFVSSGESFPKLGSFGPTIAAVEAVAWLAHRSGLPGPIV